MKIQQQCALLVALFLSTASNVVASPAKPISRTMFPPSSMRGFGTLSATDTRYTVDGSTGSALAIACESDAKARLTQAKYVSDIQLLPGVSPVKIKVGGRELAAWSAQGQGLVAAARFGKNVTLFAATSQRAMSQLLEEVLGSKLAQASFVAEVKVPTFLDRFDKYGFESYYMPFASRTSYDGPKTARGYDPVRDFAYAKEGQPTGFVLPLGPQPNETADGVSTVNAIDWLIPEAGRNGIPVGVNLDVYRTYAVLNRYPEQTIQYQPSFQGGWYGSMNFAEEIGAWSGLQAKDEALGQVQKSVRQLASNNNILDWLEPHSEMGHGIADKMLEYGPAADKTYRDYLKARYGTLANLSKRWYGAPSRLKSWDDVRVPEIYSFVGWGPNALDLAGEWRLSYDAPFDATAATSAFDDSAWPTLQTPGHGITRFLPRKPAVYRRHVNVAAAWRNAHPRVWLCTWDLNDTRRGADNPRALVHVYVNGQLIPEDPPRYSESHFAFLDVSKALQQGDNVITMTLPSGMFNGRVYLTGDEPKAYPELGPALNAQWADYADWNADIRANAVYRGSEMIRQVDPNAGIKLASPSVYVDGLSRAAKDFGGDFHDTGSQAGFWNERLCALMRGCRLPATAEPGSAAPNGPGFLAFMGRWITEGVNQIDYFQFFSDLQFMPDVRAQLAENRGTYNAIGKIHAARNQVAALYSERNTYLTSYPWNISYYPGSNPTHLGSGYWEWNPRAVLRERYDSDGLMEASFENGDAARYRVVIDSNTCIMDQKLLDGIERYVRGGGTFVTFVQTGRHTSTHANAWPIEKLTGYHVTRLTQPAPWRTNMLSFASGQSVFRGDWLQSARADGLSLRKVALDTVDLATWKDDGSVAIGMRRLGKGQIIQVGCRFTHGSLPARIDYDIWNYYKPRGVLQEYGLPPTTENGLWSPELRATSQLFDQILQSRNVAPLPARFEPASDRVIMRHDISNNGLYDVWTLWNDSGTDTVSGSVAFTAGIKPTWRVDLKDGARAAITGGRMPVTLSPLQTVVYLTPRTSIASGPAEWYDLQTAWWQGTKSAGKPFPPVTERMAVDLTGAWRFRPLTGDEPVAPLIDAQASDATWQARNLGIVTQTDYPGVHRGVFRKRFTVPTAWNRGRVLLSMVHWNRDVFVDRGAIYLDGKKLTDWGGGLREEDLTDTLRPGTSHVIAVEVSGATNIMGVCGPAWIAYHPDPAQRIDLAGAWDLSTDYLRYSPAKLPGTVDGASARRSFTLSPSASGKTVVVHATANWGGALRGVIVNGRYVARFHHWLSAEQNLNVTPYVKFGQPNELILMLAGGKATVKDVSIELHTKGAYP
ncbi:MAG TPA: beta-galactosidase trimerization domain-containing protein [Capsulimonadaceae bacterium]|jgi:hypothetical protein